MRPIPSDGSVDNDTAWRLGEISRNAGAEHVGDFIDHGLRLLRLLGEAGFTVCREVSGAPPETAEIAPRQDEKEEKDVLTRRVNRDGSRPIPAASYRHERI